MREELLAVQDEMSALTERLDFTEKLLMRGDDSADTNYHKGRRCVPHFSG